IFVQRLPMNGVVAPRAVNRRVGQIFAKCHFAVPFLDRRKKTSTLHLLPRWGRGGRTNRGVSPGCPSGAQCCETNTGVSVGWGRRSFVGLAALGTPGCHGESEADHTSASEPPTVSVIHPEVRNIVRIVEQPSFIESYERTSIYPKVLAY